MQWDSAVVVWAIVEGLKRVTDFLFARFGFKLRLDGMGSFLLAVVGAIITAAKGQVPTSPEGALKVIVDAVFILFGATLAHQFSARWMVARSLGIAAKKPH